MPEPRRTVTIEPRFCGPPGFGNGGYVSGMVAGALRDAAEVTLHRPTPVGVELEVRRSVGPEGGSAELWGPGGELLVSARPAGLDLAVPPSPSFAEAVAASAGAARKGHAFPGCFVCGPAREPGDGLRVLPGPTGLGTALAPWVPDPSLGDASGVVDFRFLWAALDCPGASAVWGDRPRALLLGRMTAALHRGVRVGERCVVLGFGATGAGRRHEVATVLYDGGGRVVGRSRQVWFEPRAEACRAA